MSVKPEHCFPAPHVTNSNHMVASSETLVRGEVLEVTTHPSDIFPLVLTSTTQELFGCCADEDVTEERPYKLLKKDDIIKDIKTRAAVSDFSPVKQTVLDYPEEEILLVFDSNFTYGQRFYLVLTPAAKDRVLRPPEPKTPEVFENRDQKTEEPKRWISLGSEKEIDADSVKKTREKLKYRFQLGRTFGKTDCFSDCNTAYAVDGCQECPVSRESRKLVHRDCLMQASPRLQSSSTQTRWTCQRNVFTEYSPRELCQEDAENNLQNLLNFGQIVIPRSLNALQQHQSVDVLLDEWELDLETEVEAGDWSGQTGLVLHQAFADHKYTEGWKVSSANWHPTILDVIAVALVEKKECHLVSRPSIIVFFSFSNSSPQLVLKCPHDVLAFEFCPSNPNIIVGGCRNGQVVLWDISAQVTYLQETQPGSTINSATTDTFDSTEKTPVVLFSAATSLASSHKGPVTDVHWLPPSFAVTKTGVPIANELSVSVQFATCSPDCTVMFWDVRLPDSLSQSLPERKEGIDEKTLKTPEPKTFTHLDRTWEPLFRVSPPKIDTSGEYVPLKFSPDPYTGDGNSEKENTENLPDYSQLRVPSAKTLKTLEDVNTKLFLGTEDGEVVYTDWKLEKYDSRRFCSSKPLHCFRAHLWLLNTLQRSPFFKDIILTTGGWNFAIWKEGVMGGSLVLSQNFEHKCTAGCWSLSRPAVFFIGTEDGSIEVWSLLEDSSKPMQIHARLTTGRITCIKPWTASSKKHFLAVTDDLGVTRAFELPRTLYRPSKNENLNVKKYFEVEEACLKHCLRREELCTTEKKEVKEPGKEKKPNTPVQVQQDTEELEMKQCSEDLMLEESVLKAMGLSQLL
ncbi:dynein axonemal intermediate chain 3 [Xenentodon cancila]